MVNEDVAKLDPRHASARGTCRAACCWVVVITFASISCHSVYRCPFSGEYNDEVNSGMRCSHALNT